MRSPPHTLTLRKHCLFASAVLFGISQIRTPSLDYLTTYFRENRKTKSTTS